MSTRTIEYTLNGTGPQTHRHLRHGDMSRSVDTLVEEMAREILHDPEFRAEMQQLVRDGLSANAERTERPGAEGQTRRHDSRGDRGDADEPRRTARP